MPPLLIKILVCFIAGAGAGIGTGFAGMSAVAVIGPMLITFLDIPAYAAVGIGLASDVLASAVSAYTYKKNGNLDMKNGIIMMIFVLLLTAVGRFVASFVPKSTMASFSVIMTMILGIKFIFDGLHTICVVWFYGKRFQSRRKSPAEFRHYLERVVFMLQTISSILYTDPQGAIPIGSCIRCGCELFGTGPCPRCGQEEDHDPA